jgi:hypothetical protein
MAWPFLNMRNYVWLLIETTNGQLLSFDLIIKSVINLPAGYWSFDNLLNWYLSGIEFPKSNNLPQWLNYHPDRLSIFKH